MATALGIGLLLTLVISGFSAVAPLWAIAAGLVALVNEPLLAEDNAWVRPYDVAPDGRILAIKEDNSVRSDHIVVVQNWLTEARAPLATPRK